MVSTGFFDNQGSPSLTLILADGKSQAKLMAQAEATLGDRSRVGLVILEFGNSDVLIGMDFLRRFGLALFVTSAAISLYDEQQYWEGLEAAQDAAGSGGDQS